MKAFRTADLQAGGGHLYASVVRYLQADMAPRLFGTDAGARNPALFTAAAGLTEMAGPSHRTRSRAFGQLALAGVLIAQQEPDQAVGIAADVLNATQSLGSYLVISQLIQLQRQLEPYSGNAVVAEFLDCLQDAVRDRLAFCQLTAEGQQHAGKAWEEP